MLSIRPALLPLLFAFFGATAFAASLPLANPGFEDGLKGWIPLEGTNPMSRTETASARTGKLGLRIEDNDTIVGSSLESAPLPAVPGKTYRLSFQARSFSTTWGLGAYLRFRDTAGQFIGKAQDKAVPPNAETWASYTLDAVAPDGAVSVIVWFHSFSTSTGAWDIDDLTLEEVEGAATTAAAPVKPALDFSKLPPLPAHPPAVVLKVDDLSVRGNGDASARWKRITDFALERKIKLSIGIIARSLDGDHPAYQAYLKKLQASGLIEFWFHGYDHGVHKEGDKDYAEFANRPYEEQKRRFDISQKLAVEKLGAPFTIYGPPGGGNTPASDADWDASTRVMAEDPAMKLWLYPKALDERGAQLQSAGKVTILDRVWQVNIEQPLFVPSADKFIAAYTKFTPGRRYFILQGHPDQWDDARWAEFVRLVDYLQQNHIPIVTPTELASTLSQS